MARSNRSKAKKVNKRAKQAEGSVFQVADAARLERLSARLAAKLREPPPLHPIGDQDEEAEEEDIMDEEGEPWFLVFALMDCDEIHCGADLGAEYIKRKLSVYHKEPPSYTRPPINQDWVLDVLSNVADQYNQSPFP